MTEKKPPVEEVKSVRPSVTVRELDIEQEPEQQALPEGHEVRKHAVLSDAEYDKAIEQARAKLNKERVAAAMKAVEQAEMERLRMELGLVTGGVGDDMVSITIELSKVQMPNIIVNMRPYWHGHTYTVPRHVADSLREMIFRGWVQEDIEDGKALAEQFQRRRETIISKKRGIINAPARPA